MFDIPIHLHNWIDVFIVFGPMLVHLPAPWSTASAGSRKSFEVNMGRKWVKNYREIHFNVFTHVEKLS